MTTAVPEPTPAPATPAAPTPTAPAGTPPPAPTPTQAPEPDPTTPTSFTQADVDRIVRDRIAREQAKYADYGDLKTKAERLAEIEAANQTDLEKAVAKAREEGKAEATQATNSVLVSAEVRALAAAAAFRDPTDALAQLRDSLGDFKVNADGSVDADAIKTALQDLATAKPYLLVDPTAPRTPQPDPSQGARPSTPQAQADAEYETYFPPAPTTRK